jgi:hypothetical protein
MKVLIALGDAVAAAGYDPADLTTDLAAGTATVLPWVGAGVGGGVILMFAFLGIRKGFAFFRSIGK